MPIHYEKNDAHVVLITIDRPEAKNSLDNFMIDLENIRAFRKENET